tara:strand:+ start:333 stop:617 length:285 start_codon:yes stop_codon:yes gene_type:complete
VVVAVLVELEQTAIRPMRVMAAWEQVTLLLVQRCFTHQVVEAVQTDGRRGQLPLAAAVLVVVLETEQTLLLILAEAAGEAARVLLAVVTAVLES